MDRRALGYPRRRKGVKEKGAEPGGPERANFLAGAWRPSRAAGRFDVRPALPGGAPGASYPRSAAEDVREALAALAAAAPGWVRTPAAARRAHGAAAAGGPGA